MSVPAAYLGVILIWSTTPLGIKWSSEGVSFIFGVSARMLIGALVCLVLIWLFRIPFPMDREARKTYLFAGLSLFSALTLTYWGGQYLPSGWISVIYGLSPLLTSVIAFVWFNDEAITPSKLLGIVLGLSGLLIIFAGDMDNRIEVWEGAALLLCAVAIYAFSTLWVKQRNSEIPAISLTAGALISSIPFYLLTWWMIDGSIPKSIADRTLSAIVYLGVFGSALGFILYYYVIKRLPAIAVSLSTLITPVLALILGHWLNNEALSWRIWAGAGLVIAGLLLHQLRLGSRPVTKALEHE